MKLDGRFCYSQPVREGYFNRSTVCTSKSTIRKLEGISRIVGSPLLLLFKQATDSPPPPATLSPPSFFSVNHVQQCCWFEESWNRRQVSFRLLGGMFAIVEKGEGYCGRQNMIPTVQLGFLFLSCQKPLACFSGYT